MPCNIFETACLSFHKIEEKLDKVWVPSVTGHITPKFSSNMKENKQTNKTPRKNIDIPFRLINKVKGEREEGIKSNW
jgi:hypothetical protein